MGTAYYRAEVQENGLLKISDPAQDELGLQPGDEVWITLDRRGVDIHTEDPNALTRAVAAMTNRTPEQRAARAWAASHYRPQNPPAPGSNGMDRIFGKWPGEESDEEIYHALEELS